MSNSSTKFFSRENNNKRHIKVSVKGDHEDRLYFFIDFRSEVISGTQSESYLRVDRVLNEYLYLYYRVSMSDRKI